MHIRRLIRPGYALLLGLLLAGLTSDLPTALASSPGVLITEVQAANTRTVADNQGSYSDWVELHNPTDTAIPITGYTLTDDPTAPAKWPPPRHNAGAGRLSSDLGLRLDQVTPEGWHTNFRLNRAGEYIGLFDPDGQLVDAVTFWEREADVSLGRLGTVSDRWVPFLFPTPGAANTTQHRLRAPPDAPAGRGHAGERTLCRPGDGAALLAGPGQLAVLHAGWIRSDHGRAGVHGTPGGDGDDGAAGWWRWTRACRSVPWPRQLIWWGKARACRCSRWSRTPTHLWDEATGIYVNAIGEGRRWERPVTAEWLSSEGEVGFSMRAGLRLHGGGSRRHADGKQSFRLYFRGEYGPQELAYALFGAGPGQTYDRLVLRAGYNDSWWTGGRRGVPAGPTGAGPARGRRDRWRPGGRWGGAVPERGLLGAIQPH